MIAAVSIRIAIFPFFHEMSFPHLNPETESTQMPRYCAAGTRKAEENAGSAFMRALILPAGYIITNVSCADNLPGSFIARICQAALEMVCES
jgi:hypothetical protein